jgi:3D (Asp-Asp-Asp) domain-containing protein
MVKKAIAGWALLTILSLSLVPLNVRGPAYVGWTSTEGLLSQTERQTAREREGGLTQKEKAGGSGNYGESYGKLQSGTLKYLTGIRSKLSGSYGALTSEGENAGLGRSTTRLLENRVTSGKGEKLNIKPFMDSRHGTLAEESKKLANSDVTLSRGSDSCNSQLGTFLVTAYTAGRESTGKHLGDKGYSVTATGTIAHEGHTISADWSVLPPGTIVEIEGLSGYYVVEDKGSGIQGKHIDLFIPDLKAALEWGRQYREVRIISKNK